MISHLSSEQVSECMLGQASPAVAQHVQHCPACRAELHQFREGLGEFRIAVRAWSEEKANEVLAIPAPALEARWGAARQLAWALVIAAVCVIASFVLPRQGLESAASDGVLLNQVDAQLSRTAPSSMEPLMKLVVEEQ